MYLLCSNFRTKNLRIARVIFVNRKFYVKNDVKSIVNYGFLRFGAFVFCGFICWYVFVFTKNFRAILMLIRGRPALILPVCVNLPLGKTAKLTDRGFVGLYRLLPSPDCELTRFNLARFACVLNYANLPCRAFVTRLSVICVEQPHYRILLWIRLMFLLLLFSGIRLGFCIADLPLPYLIRAAIMAADKFGREKSEFKQNVVR